MFHQRYRIFFFPGKVCGLLTNSIFSICVFSFFRKSGKNKKHCFFFSLEKFVFTHTGDSQKIIIFFGVQYFFFSVFLIFLTLKPSCIIFNHLAMKGERRACLSYCLRALANQLHSTEPALPAPLLAHKPPDRQDS